MSSVKVGGITVTVRTAESKDGELTMADAKKILGWTNEGDSGKEFGDKFFLKDYEGNKVRLLNNITNRPFQKPLAERYANEMLRREWQLNGETMVIDTKGHIQSAQHRLIALILANQIFTAESAEWKRYGHKNKEVTIPAIIVEGISTKDEVADSLDRGRTRSLADVVFRNQEFSKKLSTKDQTKLAWILSIALRLIWVRMGGKTVSSAKHFPVSEAMATQKKHPKIVDAVVKIFELDRSVEGEKNSIGQYVTLGYASALYYLMATSGTKSDGDINFDNIEWANGFWKAFVAGESNLMKALHVKLRGLSAAGAKGRDEICGTIVKAWELYLKGGDEVVGVKTISVAKKTKNGKSVLAENPRMGGLDIEVLPEVEEAEAASDEEIIAKAEEASVEDANKKVRKPRKAKKETKSDEVAESVSDSDNTPDNVPEGALN